MRHYGAQRVAQEHGGGGDSSVDAEVRRGRENAAAAQRRYDREGQLTYEQSDLYKRVRPPTRDRSGDWNFIPLMSTAGVLDGYRAERNGRLVGMLVHRGADLVSISTSPDEDEDAPLADEIMVAFLAAQGARR